MSLDPVRSLAAMSNKIIIRLFGGLGNQLFQYSACLALQKTLDKNTILLADLSWFNQQHKHLTPRGCDIFSLLENPALPLNWFDQLISWIGRRRLLRLWPFSLVAKEIRKEVKFSDRKVSANYSSYYYLNGYFQDALPSIDSILRMREMVSINIEKQKKFLVKRYGIDNNSVVIHVRRGDFISNISASKIHDVCSDQYYSNAIKLMKKVNPSSKFFIITDDPAYCIRAYGDKAIIISGDIRPWKNETVNDFLTICCFNNHILPNSSFSWWAAILGESQNTIIPNKWYNTFSNSDPSHYSPSRWIRLDV